jgi:nucleotide-binding universal stress UspA family protein
MAPHALISYDDTLNDHDALWLGRLLARAGARLTLAYVRHRTRRHGVREALEEREARALLDRGACWLDDLGVQRRVVVSASTGEGLGWLAEQEGADVVVFGSDYRTPAGHVAPQRSAQRLLDGGRAAVAVAPANFRSHRDYDVSSIGVLAGMGDDSALHTAHDLADRLGARLTSAELGPDLLVVGSRPEAAPGQVLLTAQAANALESSRVPVLVLPRGVAVEFPEPVSLA